MKFALFIFSLYLSSICNSDNLPGKITNTILSAVFSSIEGAYLAYSCGVVGSATYAYNNPENVDFFEYAGCNTNSPKNIECPWYQLLTAPTAYLPAIGGAIIGGALGTAQGIRQNFFRINNTNNMRNEGEKDNKAFTIESEVKIPID